MAAVAYPSYLASINDTNRAMAESALLEFSQSMERQFANSYSYLGQGVGGNDTGAPDPSVFASEAPLDGETKTYDLTISTVTQTSYTLSATPKSSAGMVGDGRIELRSDGLRCWYEGQDSSGGSCTQW